MQNSGKSAGCHRKCRGQDIIKCLAPTHLGDFALPGIDLRSRGLNRIGASAAEVDAGEQRFVVSDFECSSWVAPSCDFIDNQGVSDLNLYRNG